MNKDTFKDTPFDPWMESMASIFGGSSKNSLAQGKGFYVSFNAATDNGAETALVKKGHFLILNGDHREEYTKLIPQGYEACKEYFLTKPETERSPWSNKP